MGSPYSFMSLLSKITTKTVIVYAPTNGISVSQMNFIMAAEGYFPIIYKVNILEDIFHIAGMIWLTVCLAVILALAILYAVTLHEMRDAIYDGEMVYYSDKITSPAVYGLIKPKIVFPSSYRGKDIRFVLLHEKAHIKRGDNLWRVLAFTVTAVHWFNPFAWLFLKWFLSDLELACDEHVLSNLNDSEIKDYAYTLLDCSQNANVFVSAFGGVAIRTRIESILSFKKMTGISFAASLVLLIAILSILLTNAA